VRRSNGKGRGPAEEKEGSILCGGIKFGALEKSVIAVTQKVSPGKGLQGKKKFASGSSKLPRKTDLLGGVEQKSLLAKVSCSIASERKTTRKWGTGWSPDVMLRSCLLWGGVKRD